VLLIVGAFPDAVPPVAAVYHCNVLPVEAVAVQTGAVLFSQKLAGLIPVGAFGEAVTVIDTAVEVAVPAVAALSYALAVMEAFPEAVGVHV
jgi:hypothetical protein